MNNLILNPNELMVGGSYEGVCLLSAVVERKSKSGDKVFYNCTLSNKKNSAVALAWNKPEASEGVMVNARFKVEMFNGSQSLKIEKIDMLSAAEIANCNIDDFIPCTPIPRNALFNDIIRLATSIEDPIYKKLVFAIISEVGEKLLTDIPAAFSKHHAMIGGWAFHTDTMARSADALCNIYPILNRDLLIAGTILHDVEKRQEFVLNQSGLVSDYSLKGKLFGHLYMGAELIERKSRELGIYDEKHIIPLQHMVLSHHGIREYGAVQLPAIPEAIALNYIDLIDSRLETCREELENINPGEFSKDKILAIGGVQLYNHGLNDNSNNN